MHDAIRWSSSKVVTLFGQIKQMSAATSNIPLQGKFGIIVADSNKSFPDLKFEGFRR